MKDWRCVVVIKAWGGGVVVVELRTWQVRCMGRGGVELQWMVVGH